MPNKSIESEIAWVNDLIDSVADVAVSTAIAIDKKEISLKDGQKHLKKMLDSGKHQAHAKLKTLIQREVKKGRVEELEKLNQNLIKSGVEEKAEERIMLVIDDRLEELENDNK